VKSRTAVVPPKIIPDSDILIVGQAPGEKEEEFGEPFVGPAGRKLKELCAQAGLSTYRISYANVVCCRPLKREETKYGVRFRDAAPEPSEVKNCYLNLERTIQLASPKVMVAAGAPALKRLTGKTGIRQMNGQVIVDPRYEGIPIVPMLHPSYVRQNPGLAGEAVYALKKVAQILTGDIKVSLGEYKYALSIDDFREMLDELEKSDRFTIDIEATKLRDFQTAQILCMSFSTREGTAWGLPWRVGTPEFYAAVENDRNQTYTTPSGSIRRKAPSVISDVHEFGKKLGISDVGFRFYWEHYPEVWERLDKLFRSSRMKILHNVAYDAKVLQNKVEHQGFRLAQPTRDTMIMHYLVDETRFTHGLDALAARNTTMGNYKEMIRPWVKFKATAKHTGDTYAIVPPQVLLRYCAADSDATFRIHTIFEDSLAQPRYRRDGSSVWKGGMLELVDKFIMPVRDMLTTAEEYGVLLDLKQLGDADAKLRGQIQRQADEIFAACGVQGLNLNSPDQIRRIFYDKLRFKVFKKTPTDKPSTDDETLGLLVRHTDHPAPRLLRKWRKMDKLHSTYVVGLRNQIWTDGRLHTSFSMIATDTGRLASSKPNLQNIPRPRPGEVNIRNSFICPPGYRLVQADASQAELRGMAFEAQDRNAIQMFREGRDPHSETAHQIHPDLPPGQKESKEQRVIAKEVGFGIAYGTTADGLATRLSNEHNIPTSTQQAQGYIDAFFRLWCDTPVWIERVKESVRRDGFAQSYFGRRKHLPHINSPEDSRRRKAERMATNHMTQSWASDVNLFSALKILNELARVGWSSSVYLWNVVHDNIVWVVREDIVEPFIRNIVQPSMTQWVTKMIGFPFEIEADVGDRWGSLQEFCFDCGLEKSCFRCKKT